jgi:hypothetical protein
VFGKAMRHRHRLELTIWLPETTTALARVEGVAVPQTCMYG